MRRESPRRSVDNHTSIAGRVCVVMYATGPLIAFTATGSFTSLCVTLTMLWWGFRPLKWGWL
jgi:hypothetical protein